MKSRSGRGKRRSAETRGDPSGASKPPASTDAAIAEPPSTTRLWPLVVVAVALQLWFLAWGNVYPLLMSGANAVVSGTALLTLFWFVENDQSLGTSAKRVLARVLRRWCWVTGLLVALTVVALAIAPIHVSCRTSGPFEIGGERHTCVAGSGVTIHPWDGGKFFMNIFRSVRAQDDQSGAAQITGSPFRRNTLQYPDALQRPSGFFIELEFLAVADVPAGDSPSPFEVEFTGDSERWRVPREGLVVGATEDRDVLFATLPGERGTETKAPTFVAKSLAPGAVVTLTVYRHGKRCGASREQVPIGGVVQWSIGSTCSAQ